MKVYSTEEDREIFNMEVNIDITHLNADDISDLADALNVIVRTVKKVNDFKTQEI